MPDPRDILNPVTANQRLFDSAIRHAIGLRRLSAGEARKIRKLLEIADRELMEILRKRLAEIGAGVSIKPTAVRMQQLLAEIRQIRRLVMLQLGETLTKDLTQLASIEVQKELQILESAIPIDFDFAGVTPEKLATIVKTKPFQGRNLGKWLDSLTKADQNRLDQAVRLGLTEGETVQGIARRIGGTRAGGFQDGVLAISRRNAEAVARTAINHVSNSAREAVWDANEDIIEALRWTSTLDGRTTAICISRDGKFVAVGGRKLKPNQPALKPKGARPPAHVS